MIRALARVFDIVRVLSSDKSPIFGVEMIMVKWRKVGGVGCKGNGWWVVWCVV